MYTKDLKMANIMVQPRSHKIKIVDFGFACKAKTEKYGECAQGSGSPMYIDPYLMNQGYAEENDYDVRVIDIYSLGVIFFMIMTERVTFDLTFKVKRREDIVRAKKEIINTIDRELSTDMKSMGENPLLRLLYSMTKSRPRREARYPRRCGCFNENSR